MLGCWVVAFFSAAMDIEEEGAVQMISYASDTESASLRLVKSEKIVKRSVVASVDLCLDQWPCTVWAEIERLLSLYCSLVTVLLLLEREGVGDR